MNGNNWHEMALLTGFSIVTLAWLVRGLIKEFKLMQSNKAAH